MWTAIERRGMGMDQGMERIGAWMAASTAKLAGLADRKGALVVGADADIVVFDPKVVWTVAPKHLHFRHKLSPYLGAELRGRVLETWLRGEPVYMADDNLARFIDSPRGRDLTRSQVLMRP